MKTAVALGKKKQIPLKGNDRKKGKGKNKGKGNSNGSVSCGSWI